MLAAVGLVLLNAAAVAQTPASSGLDWRYLPQAHEVAIWDAPGETDTLAEASDTEEPAPVILPQPEFIDEPETGPIRGWQWKEPSLSTGGQVAAYEEERTAVQIAESRQEEQMAQQAEPPPGIDNLPGPLQDFTYRVDFGVEYRF